MANDVTVNINAETNVPEAADKSKKAMSQMETAMDGMNKKMSSFGKDLILSYLAPMVLLNKAFDYVSQKIEENKQKAKEAMDFAAKGESKELEPAFVRIAQDKAKREKEADEKEKSKISRSEGARDFLENATDADMERLYKRLGPGSRILLNIPGPVDANKFTAVQNAVRDIKNADILREQEARGKQGIDTMAVQNAVFGMGSSPIISSMQEQLDVQRQQADTLRRIEERLPPKEEDYTKNTGSTYKPTISFR